MHIHNVSASAETDQNSKSFIPFPSTLHPHTPRSCIVRMPTITDDPRLPPRVATPFTRSTSPVHSSTSHFTRYIPRMSLFREVMRDEVYQSRSLWTYSDLSMPSQLCYTAVITAFTVVSVAMTLVGVKSAGGINTDIWVTFDCTCIVTVNRRWLTLDSVGALISLLVMHSFGRVLQRHENES